MEYTLDKLEPYTNYTATMWGTRGSNLTSSASVNFTTGTAVPVHVKGREGCSGDRDAPHLHLLSQG